MVIHGEFIWTIALKKIGLSIIATVFIYFLSMYVILPIIINMGYSSAEASYHAATHAILLSLIYTVIYCTMIIIEEIRNIKIKFDGDRKE